MADHSGSGAATCCRAVADSQKRVAEDVQAKEEEIESKISALKLKRQNLQSEKASLEQGLKRVQAELVQEEDRLAQLMGAQSAETAAMVVEENLSEDEGASPRRLKTSVSKRFPAYL